MMLGDLLSLLPKNLNKQLRPTIDEVHDWVEQLQTALVSREAERQNRSSLPFSVILTGNITGLNN